MTKILLLSEAQRQTALNLIVGLDLAKPWTIEVSRPTKKRSLNQSALYFKWCGIVAQETGNSIEDIHTAMKQKFCPVRIINLDGTEVSIQTTTGLTVQEFSSYMVAVEGFVNSELGILLPAQEV